MAYWDTPGQSDEWYTPPWIFDALGCTFDLDVASPPEPVPTHVPAKHRISENSLAKQWSGFVWMNPPFGGRNSLGPWLDKFFNHGHGIALTPDRTSAPWFQDAWDRTDCAIFMPKVRFLRPDGTEGKSPSNGTTLWASGNRAARLFRGVGRELGILAKPIRSAP